MDLKKNTDINLGKTRLQPDDLATIILFIPLSLLFIVELRMSLNWPMFHDVPIMHYYAFLIDYYDFSLYKDVFDVNLPGTILLHLATGKLFGYDDLAIRLADIIWLSGILLVTWGIMIQFGKRVAWASVVLFGLEFLKQGLSASFQRDYLGILPICMAVYLAVSCHRLNFSFQNFLIGILFGLSVTIKPPLAIGLPFVLFFQWRHKLSDNTDREFHGSSLSIALSVSFFCFIGFVLPILSVLIWLWHRGVLSEFFEMFFSYLPLHVDLTQSFRILHGVQKLKYLIGEYLKLGGLSFWFISAFLGVFLASFESNLSSSKKRVVYLLSCLAIIYSIYPVVSGQFFPYHWMPFRYFIVILASLTLVRLPVQFNSIYKRIFPVFVLGITLFLALCPGGVCIYRQFTPDGLSRVHEIAGYLKLNLKKGDKVQPIDFAGGALHAMLLSKAELATPFVYDYVFYHHISNPYVHTLRQRFIQDLVRVRPRFIIEIQTGKAKVWGPDTTTEFKELTDIINTYYLAVFKGDGYVIHERKK